MKGSRAHARFSKVRGLITGLMLIGLLVLVWYALARRHRKTVVWVNAGTTTKIGSVHDPEITNNAITEHQKIATLPLPTKMDYTAVVEVWQKSALASKIPNTGILEVSNWLIRILSHQHRLIDSDSLSAFRDSLNTFISNSGTDFSSTDQRATSVLWLKFCCDMAWSDSADEGKTSSIIQSYNAFDEKLMSKLHTEIESSIPIEKKKKWSHAVQEMLARIKSKLDLHVMLLNKDFLFPGFKTEISDITERTLFEQVNRWGLTPKYGVVRQIMQTDDEAFQWQLDRLSLNADVYVTFYLAFSDLARLEPASKYWCHYAYGCKGKSGLWPMEVILSHQITSLPASNGD